jgi:CRP/FNR family transcriptional regulator, anaerobic regulatory protein
MSGQAWLEHFPQLTSIQDSAGLRALNEAQLITVPKDTTVFKIGGQCDNYFLVMNGRVRVQQLAANGREIVLYRVHAGESCVLTTSCLMASNKYPAQGITETEVEAVMIPAQLFHEALTQSEGFRRFVLEGYGQRITDLLMVIEDLAFRRLDSRLAERLITLSAGSSQLNTTHQALAVELGSAREVVSRQLKEFERKGWIQMGRGTIDIIDVDHLSQLIQCD